MPRQALDILYELGYDTAGAVSSSATLDMVNLRWTAAVLTMRRRAPDSLLITVPRHHGYTFGEFDAWRELRIRRNGVNWWGGFQGAMRAPGGESGEVMVMEAYGSAAALVQFNKDAPGSSDALGISNRYAYTRTSAANASRADEIINDMLDLAVRATPYPGTPWFKAADRTIDTGTFTPTRFSMSGVGRLVIVQTVCDSEGWEWRVGIASDGDFTFEAGATVAEDLTDEIKLYSPANCLIESYEPDASQLATIISVVTRVRDHETTLSNSPGAGTSTITVDGNAQQFIESAQLIIDPGGGNEELVEVNAITDAQTFTINGTLGNSHTAGEVVMVDPQEPFVREIATTGKTSGSRHHHLERAIYNDQITSEAGRGGLAATYLADLDDLVQSIPVRMTDIEFAEEMLSLGLRPGDTISLTSEWLPFDDTDLVVQEVVMELDPGGVVSMRLTLGDPAQDALSVVERMLAAARASATATGGVSA